MIELPRGSVGFNVGDDRVDVARRTAEVAALHVGVDVEDRLDVVVGDDRGRRRPASKLARLARGSWGVRRGPRGAIGVLSRASRSSRVVYCGVCTATA